MNITKVGLSSSDLYDWLNSANKHPSCWLEGGAPLLDALQFTAHTGYLT